MPLPAARGRRPRPVYSEIGAGWGRGPEIRSQVIQRAEPSCSASNLRRASVSRLSRLGRAFRRLPSTHRCSISIVRIASIQWLLETQCFQNAAARLPGCVRRPDAAQRDRYCDTKCRRQREIHEFQAPFRAHARRTIGFKKRIGKGPVPGRKNAADKGSQSRCGQLRKLLSQRTAIAETPSSLVAESMKCPLQIGSTCFRIIVPAIIEELLGLMASSRIDGRKCPVRLV